VAPAQSKEDAMLHHRGLLPIIVVISIKGKIIRRR
jgi:hypothetical protein